MSVRKRPSDFVPSDEYRLNKLPDELRSFATNFADELGESFEENDGENYAEYKRNRFRTVSEEIGKWWTSGSERDVLCVGQFFKGREIYAKENISIVLKFNPLLSLNETRYETPRESGNLAELQIWEYIWDNNYMDYFGNIVDFSETGSWLAMVEYIPYYPYSEPKHTTEFVSKRKSEHPYGHILQHILDEEGIDIDIHIKNGNVGLYRGRKEKLVPVCIDFGSHTAVSDLNWTYNN